MRQELEDLKEAWTSDVGGGRDDELAREIADGLVANAPELFVDISPKPLQQLCADIDVFRQGGFEDQVWLIEAWLLHKYEPQNIGGVYEPQVRIVPEGEV